MADAGTLRLMTELTAKDLTGQGLASATQNTKKYTARATASFAQLENKVLSYGRLVGSILTSKVISRGFAYLEEGIMDVGRTMIDMDQAMTSASAKFGGNIERGSEAWAQMEAVVRETGLTTQYTSAETAQALDFLAMAGFGYQESLRALPALTDLATASQTDFARASDIASDALGAFNKSTAPEDIERNLTRISDVFAKTVTTSNTTMETLFDTMKLAGPVVKGGEVMFGTLAGTLGSAGIKGTIAATTMKNMFLRLQAPPAEARKSLKKLRLEIDDGTGQMKDMITILDELDKAFAGKNEIEREKFLKDIFGQRAISGVKVLLRTGTQELRNYYNLLDNSQGAAAKMAETMRGGLANQIKLLQSALTGKGMEIFTGLLGGESAGERIMELVDIVREFDVGPIVQGLKDIGHFVKTTSEFLWEHRNLLLGIVKVYGSVALVNKVTSLAGSIGQAALSFGGAGGLNAQTLTATTNMAAMTKSVGLAKTGIAAFNPVVASLVAGLAAGTALWENMNEIQLNKEARENKLYNLFHGKGEKGKALSIQEQEKELQKLQMDWKRQAPMEVTGMDKYTGLPTYGRRSLLEGEFAQDKELRMKQEAARRLQSRITGYYSRVSEATSIRNRMYGGEFQAPQEVSSEYWQGQGVGPSEAWKLEQTGQNVSGWSVPPPQITWEPKQEFKVDVTVNGLPEGAGASATVEKAPPMTETTLGAPNG